MMRCAARGTARVSTRSHITSTTRGHLRRQSTSKSTALVLPRRAVRPAQKFALVLAAGGVLVAANPSFALSESYAPSTLAYAATDSKETECAQEEEDADDLVEKEEIAAKTTVGRLLSEMKTDWIYFVVSTLSGLLSGLAKAAIPMIVGQIYDALNNKSDVTPALLQLVAVNLASAALNFLSNCSLSFAINRLSARLQIQHLDSMLHQDIAAFSRSAGGAGAEGMPEASTPAIESSKSGRQKVQSGNSRSALQVKGKSRPASAGCNRISGQGSEDITTMCTSVRHGFQRGIQSTAAVVGGTASLFMISPTLSTFMLISIPVGSYVFNSWGKHVKAMSRQTSAQQGRTTAHLAESLNALMTVQSNQAEAMTMARYEEEANKARALQTQLGWLRIAFFGSLAVAMNAVTVVVLAGGAHLASTGQITQGEVAAYMNQLKQTVAAVGALTRLVTELTDGQYAAERVFGAIDDEPTIDRRHRRGSNAHATSSSATTSAGADSTDSGDAHTHAHAELHAAVPVRGRVDFEDVRFSYPGRSHSHSAHGTDTDAPHDLSESEKPAVDALSLTLEAGAVTALVGESGSGKSTVALLLDRLYDPTHGAIKLDGVPLTDLDPHFLRDHIGVVGQEPVLFSTTIRENIGIGSGSGSGGTGTGTGTGTDTRANAVIDATHSTHATHLGVEEAARQAGAHGFIESLPMSYDTLLGPSGAGLSAGQKQRIAIARAIQKNPKILILDEATSALDVHTESELLADLKTLMKGKTTLIVAHRLSTIQNADRIVVMGAGRVLEQGTHSELLARGGAYARLVKCQQEQGGSEKKP